MANPTSVIDFRTTLAAFLATSVSDGTYSDVIITTKTDQPGEEAPATAIPQYGGRLWANMVDDFIRTRYVQIEGAGLVDVDTTDATPTDTLLVTVANDGDAYEIDMTVTGKGPAGTGDVAVARISAVIQRTASATFSTVGLVSTYDPGTLAGSSVALTTSSNDVNVTITGVGATDIGWRVQIHRLKALRDFGS